MVDEIIREEMDSSILIVVVVFVLFIVVVVLFSFKKVKTESELAIAYKTGLEELKAKYIAYQNDVATQLKKAIDDATSKALSTCPKTSPTDIKSTDPNILALQAALKKAQDSIAGFEQDIAAVDAANQQAKITTMELQIKKYKRLVQRCQEWIEYHARMAGLAKRRYDIIWNYFAAEAANQTNLTKNSWNWFTTGNHYEIGMGGVDIRDPTQARFLPVQDVDAEPAFKDVKVELL